MSDSRKWEEGKKGDAFLISKYFLVIKKKKIVGCNVLRSVNL